MNTTLISRAGAIALVTLFAGCATWSEMDRTEKGTAAGATTGALAGAVVAGPVGAAVGAGVGGYVGHHQGFGRPGAGDAMAANRYDERTGPARGYDADLVRAAQASLNDRGFDAGPVDGVWGPGTEAALRNFQRANGMDATGDLDPRTRAALGIR
jgi:hypothetical protein